MSNDSQSDLRVRVIGQNVSQSKAHDNSDWWKFSKRVRVAIHTVQNKNSTKIFNIGLLDDKFQTVNSSSTLQHSSVKQYSRDT